MIADAESESQTVSFDSLRAWKNPRFWSFVRRSQGYLTKLRMILSSLRRTIVYVASLSDDDSNAKKNSHLRCRLGCVINYRHWLLVDRKEHYLLMFSSNGTENVRLAVARWLLSESRIGDFEMFCGRRNRSWLKWKSVMGDWARLFLQNILYCEVVAVVALKARYHLKVERSIYTLLKMLNCNLMKRKYIPGRGDFMEKVSSS